MQDLVDLWVMGIYFGRFVYNDKPRLGFIGIYRDLYHPRSTHKSPQNPLNPHKSFQLYTQIGLQCIQTGLHEYLLETVIMNGFMRIYITKLSSTNPHKSKHGFIINEGCKINPHNP